MNESTKKQYHNQDKENSQNYILGQSFMSKGKDFNSSRRGIRSQSQNNNPIQSALLKLNQALEGTQNIESDKNQFTVGKESAGSQFNKYKRQRAGYSFQVGSALSKNTINNSSSQKQNFFMGRSFNQTQQQKMRQKQLIQSQQQISQQMSGMKLSQINYKQQQKYESSVQKRKNINSKLQFNQANIEGFTQISGGLLGNSNNQIQYQSNLNNTSYNNNNFNNITMGSYNNYLDSKQQQKQTNNNFYQTNTTLNNQSNIPPTKLQTMKTILNLRARSRATSAYQSRRVDNNTQLNLNRLDVTKVENCLQETEFIHKIPINYLLDLYSAKCADNMLEYTADMATKFIEKVKLVCKKRKLNFQENQFGAQSAKVISQILESTDYFSHLFVQKNNIQSQGVIYLADAIQNNYGLIHIDLAGNNIQQEAMGYLIKSLKNHPSIISISLGSKEGLNRNRIGIQGASELGKLLKSNYQLIDLNLANCGLNVQSLSCLLEGLKYIDDSNLNSYYDEIAQTSQNKRISFEEMIYLLQQMMFINLSSQDIKEFQQFFDVKNQEMKIQKFTKSDFQKLVTKATSIERGSLEILDLSYNDFSQGLFECFKHIRNTPLKKLNLSNCQIKDKNLDILSNMLKKNKGAYKIQYLNLSNNGLTGQGIGRFFLNAQNLDSLKEIILDDNNFKDRDFSFVSSFMGQNKNLEVFSVQNCNIDKQYGDSLAYGLSNNKNLKKFYLNGNRLYDEGTQNLGEAIAESQLQVLEISTCQISDVSAEKIINGIIKSNKLRVLNFKDNKINDKTGKLLAQAAHLVKSLEKINVSRTVISYYFVEQMNQKIKQNQLNKQQQQFPNEIEEMKNLQAKSEQFNEINQNKEEDYTRKLEQLIMQIEIIEQNFREVSQQEKNQTKEIELIHEKVKNEEKNQNNQEILQNKSRNAQKEATENQITVFENKIGNCLDEIHQIEKKIQAKKSILNQKKQTYNKTIDEQDQQLQMLIWMGKKQNQNPNELKVKCEEYKSKIDKITEFLEKYEQTGEETYLIQAENVKNNKNNNNIDENKDKKDGILNNNSQINVSKNKSMISNSGVKKSSQKNNQNGKNKVQNQTISSNQVQNKDFNTEQNDNKTQIQKLQKPTSASGKKRSSSKQKVNGKKKI